MSLRISWMLLVIPCFFFGGCVSSVRTYDGPVRPPDDVGIVTVPVALEVLRVDGEPFRKAMSFSRSGDLALELLPGTRTLTVQYYMIWPTANNHEPVRSRPVDLTLEVAPGGRYALVHPSLDDLEAARAFARKPEIRVDTRAAGSLLAEAGPEARPPVTATAPAGAQPAPAPETVTTVEPAAAGAEHESALLAALKKFWAEATPEDRQSFLLWITGTR